MNLVEISGKRLLNLDAVTLVVPRMNDGQPLLTLIFAPGNEIQFAGQEAIKVAQATSDISNYEITF